MTILETAPIMEYTHTHAWMIFTGLITIIIMLVIAKMAEEVYNDPIMVISGIIAILGLIFMLVGLVYEINEKEVDTGRIKYTIKCDDSIGLNEFYNKYKILEHTQYTDVYVVEEISTND